MCSHEYFQNLHDPKERRARGKLACRYKRCYSVTPISPPATTVRRFDRVNTEDFSVLIEEKERKSKGLVQILHEIKKG
jgi:hypothetical protein